MAYCSHCGSQVNGAYCSNCGTKIEQSTISSGSSFSYTKDPTFKLPEATRSEAKQTMTKTPDVSQYKLGWHKFLIYFYLWACGFWDIYVGAQELQLASYDGAFGFFGIFGIALGVFAIIARFRLAGFKENAPKLIVLFFVITGCINFLEALYIGSNFGFDNLDSMYYTNILMVIPFAIITWRYYSSRQELFIC